MDLWEEFEQRETEEAKFAQALDKLEALIQHNEADIKTWNSKEIELSFCLTHRQKECKYDEMLLLLKNIVDEETWCS